MSNYTNLSPLHIQSNGGGVQSFAMYMMASKGILPKFDYSIFVDLGHERKGTYKAVELMKIESQKPGGIPLIIIEKKNLMNDTIASIKNSSRRWVSIPFFSSGVKENIGMLRRQCTSEYKIRQVNECIKALYGLSGNQRFPETYVYIGISLDEAHRMSTPEPVKFSNVFPFLLYQTGYNRGNVVFRDPKQLTERQTRNNLIAWIKENNLFLPPNSSCIFCPYTSDKDWIDLKNNEPANFELACQFDESIRDGTPGNINSKLFLHRSGVPLRKVNFQSTESNNLFECSGHCHV